MDTKQINQGLLEFIDRTPNSFFAVENIARLLRDAGFRYLPEGADWNPGPGDYYTTRNGSALIALRIPAGDWTGFQLLACHGDSPAFKLKTNPFVSVEDRYLKLNLEKYGGMICSTWFDRPLSVAGRAVVRTAEGISVRLVRIDRDLLVIPSLAIHMDRNVNDGRAFNVQEDMLPLAGCGGREEFEKLIAAAAEAEPEDVLDTDLYLYNRMPGTYLGLHAEFIAAGRLDDLQCAWAGVQGFLHAAPKHNAAVYCLFDNEEVGSLTRQGAASTFLKDTLRRVSLAFGRDERAYLRSLANSFLVSADNAHGVHPNHRGKADPTNRPVLNGGVVVKYNAAQRYTTDAVSGALLRLLCERAEVPVQTFANRADMAGGSTLGNLSSAQVAVKSVDIGLAQLAMHSAYETAGAEDTAYLARTAQALFSSSLREERDGELHLD